VPGRPQMPRPPGRAQPLPGPGRPAEPARRRRQPSPPSTAPHASSTCAGSGAGVKVKVSTPPFTLARAVPGANWPLNENNGVTSPGLLKPVGRVTELNDPAVYATGPAVAGAPTADRVTVNGLVELRFDRSSVPAG